MIKRGNMGGGGMERGRKRTEGVIETFFFYSNLVTGEDLHKSVNIWRGRQMRKTENELAGTLQRPASLGRTTC